MTGVFEVVYEGQQAWCDSKELFYLAQLLKEIKKLHIRLTRVFSLM